MSSTCRRGTPIRALSIAAAALLAGCSSDHKDPEVLTLIGVTPGAPSLAPGATQQLTATGWYSTSTSRDLTAEVTWASSDTRVATVSAGGVVTAGTLTGGSTLITATLGDQVGFTPLTVTGAELFGIRLYPAAVSEPVGIDTKVLTIGRYSDDSERDLTSVATYAVADTAVATVAQGAVRGVAAGSTSMQVSAGGFTASASVAVTSATLAALQVAPTNAPQLATGRTEGFTAIAEYDDGTYFDVTDGATWESDDTAIVSFGSTPGQATAVAAGTANVTATFGGATSAPQPLKVEDGHADYVESRITFEITSMDGATLVVMGDDEDLALPAIADFTFRFYGIDYTTDQIFVTTNGNIFFNYDYDWYPAGPYPNSGSAHAAAVAYGDDLITAVRYEVLGTAPSRQLVLDWDGAFYDYPTEPVHLQMVLHEGTNLIDFRYIDIGEQYGANAIVGIQNQPQTAEDPMLGTQHSNADYLLVPGLALRFSP